MHNEEANNLELSAGNQCSLPEVSVTQSFHLTSPSLSMQTDILFFNKRTRSLRGNRNAGAIFGLGVLPKVLDRCVPPRVRMGFCQGPIYYKDPPIAWTINTVTIPHVLRQYNANKGNKTITYLMERDPKNHALWGGSYLYSPYTGYLPSPTGGRVMNSHLAIQPNPHKLKMRGRSSNVNCNWPV